MEWKKIWVPIVLAVLAILFACASFMLWFNKGKSAKWVARKMKLGGLILSLTAILAACDPAQTQALLDSTPPYTCYLIAQPVDTSNIFYLESIIDSAITLNISKNNTVSGEIRNRTSSSFSFAVFDNNNEKVQKENISAKDGNFDKSTEQFKISIDRELNSGDYILRFFDTDTTSQGEWSEQYINLILK